MVIVKKLKTIIMKTRLIIAIAVLTFGVVSMSSCSKCYKCSHYVYIDNNGVTDSTETVEDFCTASAQELEDKEKEGETCTAS